MRITAPVIGTCLAAVAASAGGPSQIGTLDENSPTFDRRSDALVSNFFCSVTANDSVNDGVPYQVFAFRPTTNVSAGTVSAISLEATPADFDPFLSVYLLEFDAGQPVMSLLAIDDDSLGHPNAQASFSGCPLNPSNKLIAVVSSYSNYQDSNHGSFSLILGPGFEFTRLCEADLDDNGSLNFGDVTTFLTLYGQGNLDADLDFNGTLNFGDVTAFLNLYAMGCP